MNDENKNFARAEGCQVHKEHVRTFEFVLPDVDYGWWVHGCREEVVDHFFPLQIFDTGKILG